MTNEQLIQENAQLKAQVNAMRAAANPVVNNYFYWSGINEPDLTCDHDVKLHKIMTELSNALQIAKVDS